MLSRFRRNDRGSTSIQYAILACCIGIAIIPALAILRGELQITFVDVASQTAEASLAALVQADAATDPIAAQVRLNGCMISTGFAGQVFSAGFAGDALPAPDYPALLSCYVEAGR